MIKDLTIDQKILADFMSEISERCYSAGWMTNLEYVLWDTLTTGPRKYGHDTISQSDIVELRKYSEKADSWIFFDDDIDEIGVCSCAKARQTLCKHNCLFHFQLKNKLILKPNIGSIGDYLQF